LNLMSAKTFADELALDLPMILTNGAILETRKEEILFRMTLQREAVEGIIQISDEQGGDLVIYIENRAYVREKTENIVHVYRHVIEKLIVVQDWNLLEAKFSDINKMLIVDMYSEAYLDEIGRKIYKKYPEMIDVVRASSTLVEMMPKGVDKASGLRRLAQMLGIPMCRVMAFGDYDNDAEMLKSAGLGVAVENASENAKKAADLVIDSVDKDGPAKFLLDLIN